jgi:enoyl-CoA hydratase/carnithine racemase
MSCLHESAPIGEEGQVTENNVLVDVRDGVAQVTLNRPERRNPISEPAMVDDFVTALSRLGQDVNVRVVILTGAGTAFSAGGDIFAMADNLERRRSEPLRTVNDYQVGIQRIPEEIDRLAVPIIAAVNGPAVGAGCDLACMCDIRLASDKAKFAESFVRLGLIPGDGGAWFLQRVIGYARACELTFTGDTIDAGTALSIGLVSAVHPHAELLDRAGELARRIAQNPPDAVRAAKRLIKFAQHGSLADTLELSANAQALAHTSPEHRDAVAASVAMLKARSEKSPS